MKFLNSQERPPAESRNLIWLKHQDWNDWWRYAISYNVIFYDSAGTGHRLGGVRITSPDLKPADKAEDGEETYYPSPIPLGEFSSLKPGSVSLGESSSYYKKIEKIPFEDRRQYLSALLDGVDDLSRLLAYRNDPVFKTSLLREASLSTIEDEYYRALHGIPEYSSFNFVYQSPHGDEFDFVVDPQSFFPSNLHVLIGTNGIGKTTFLKEITRLLVSTDETKTCGGNPQDPVVEDDDLRSLLLTEEDFQKIDDGDRLVAQREPTTLGRVLARDSDGSWLSASEVFNDIHFISWSAFDHFDEVREWIFRESAKFSRIKPTGITTLNDDGEFIPLSPAGRDSGEFDSFRRSLDRVRKGKAQSLWQASLVALESDPVFKELNIYDVCMRDNKKELKKFFKSLSDGHKVVLLTVTYLSGHLDEHSLVLLDEPEAHLHPPLLSALTRCLRDLLRNRNSVGIVSTHSPVVLQEVQSDNVWIIDRIGDIISGRRPDIETYGEDVGLLTHQVFGLQVSQSGFHDEMRIVSARYDSFDEALKAIGGRVGAVGKSILRSMYVARDQESNKVRAKDRRGENNL